MALQGSLADFGIAEILQLIGSQQKTGILHVKGEDASEEVMIYFSSGRIIRTDVAGRDKRDLIGQMLVSAEVISRDQLTLALKTQKKTLERVGEVLVGMGAASREVINEFVELQARETLYRLFEWKAGIYRFESKPPNFARPTGAPLSSESLLMEGFRMLDEWPLIRAKINNYSVVFRPIRAVEHSETEAAALERILDDAFSEFVDGPPGSMGGAPGEEGDGAELERFERRVMGLVDGKRDVFQIIDLSRLGEFETCKALLKLLDEGYIEPVKVKKALEAPARRRGMSWRNVGTRVVVNLALVGLIGAAVLLMPRSRIELRRNTEQVMHEALARLRANRIVAVSTALEVHRAERGSYPDDLNALVKGGYLDPEVLDLPGGQSLAYVGIGTDYDLR
ncbi:MAG: DUF4388 domain-containing protein [Myxococcales bacterium]|nr:DUF4388 domain-containing protein [Myxococcales bacterium]